MGLRAKLHARSSTPLATSGGLEGWLLPRPHLGGLDLGEERTCGPDVPRRGLPCWQEEAPAHQGTSRRQGLWGVCRGAPEAGPVPGRMPPAHPSTSGQEAPWVWRPRASGHHLPIASARAQGLEHMLFIFLRGGPGALVLGSRLILGSSGCARAWSGRPGLGSGSASRPRIPRPG